MRVVVRSLVIAAALAAGSLAAVPVDVVSYP
jgi:hypothetical protein